MFENERWKDIIGFEGLYQISNWGRVKALTRTLPHKTYGTWTIKEKILKPSLNGEKSKGYLFVILFDKNKKAHNMRIHRLVAQHFVKNPDRGTLIFVDHIDGDKTNNYYKNLEWVTPLENTRRAIKLGLMNSHEIDRTYCMKKVVCVETGQIFNSVKEAANFVGVAPTNLSQACLKNRRAKGKHFKYLENSGEVK